MHFDEMLALYYFTCIVCQVKTRGCLIFEKFQLDIIEGLIKARPLKNGRWSSDVWIFIGMHIVTLSSSYLPSKNGVNCLNSVL